MACVSINYLGGFTSVYREAMEKSWLTRIGELDIPIPPGYTLADTLETPISIRDWNIQGLPNDQFSVDNGIITK
jgi:dynein heavy chain, axonemal